MTTQTLTLTDFLLARIAEDEGMAHADATMTPPSVRVGTTWPNHDPARRLVECEAKRRIVRMATAELSYSADGADYLEALALPYADHPDYREEWKP